MYIFTRGYLGNSTSTGRITSVGLAIAYFEYFPYLLGLGIFFTSKRNYSYPGWLGWVLGKIFKLRRNNLGGRRRDGRRKNGTGLVWGGGTNLSDKGLNLRGSWQQGHSAPYNTPSRI